MQNRHGELTIICKAKDLVNHTLQLTNNTKLFPKKVRFTLCQRMQNLFAPRRGKVLSGYSSGTGVYRHQAV